MQRTPLVRYNQYKRRYDSSCISWKFEPVSERKVNNPVCLAVLIMIIGFFVGVGGYYIATKSDYEQANNQEDITFSFNRYNVPIIICTLISIPVSLIYIVLVKLFPRGMVYTMIFLSLGLIAAVAVFGIISANYGLAISFGIVFLIYSVILSCFRDRVKTGIVLVKVATKFITQKPIVFLTPIFKIIMTALFVLFWIYTLMLIIQRIIYYNTQSQDPTKQYVFSFIWFFIWFFFTVMFYYLMVFTIAVTCAFWYYRVQGKNPIVAAYQWIYKSALGAITYAALVVTLFTFIRLFINEQRRMTKNFAVAACLCMMSFMSRYIEDLIQILNHNAIICMAVTGQDFINSAKTAIGIVCSDLPLFLVSRLITNFLVFWGITISVAVSCVVAYLWVGVDQNLNNYAILVIVMVGLSSVKLSIIIYAVLVESISSVFIYYLFDTRFKQLGIPCHNMPIEIIRELGYHFQNSTINSAKQYELK